MGYNGFMARQFKGGRDEAQKRYREKNREKRNARNREYYAINKERIKKHQSFYRKTHVEIVNKANASWRSKFWSALRTECIQEYGGRCICCGESERAFLELDHIFNDGAKERKKHKNSQQEMLALKRLGWPKERHQILCANCNRGKAREGICPHQKKNR